jgi:CRP-like cAMP-binding protein/HEAT repeat protein
VVDEIVRHGLVEATRDPDARVRVAAIGALVRLGGIPTSARADGTPGAPDLGALSHDPDARVRAAAVVASAGDDHPAVIELVSVPMSAVRATALHALTPADGEPLDPDARAVAVQALSDPVGRVRSAAAITLGADDTQPTDLLPLLDGPRRTAIATLDALTRSAERFGLDQFVRGSVLAFADGQVGRVTRLRHIRGGMGQPARPIAAFLASTIALRERAALTSLLGALAVLGAPEASGLVRRCLGSDDPDVRAQAIEALEALGEPRLARRVTHLLDEDPSDSDGVAPIAVLDALAHDDDPWLRRLAQACREEPTMPDATRTMTELETMLALRRVSMFEGLEPEDLQRIAAFAVERTYAPGEILMTEGELSDELVVLLAGGVRVERVGPDGTPRFLRSYGAGEHIGELAVLRERPRSATVTADTEGARGLVVPGVGLRDILRERPDAAMAMLATLAERVSRQ